MNKYHMKKNYFIIIFLLLLNSYAFSQSAEKPVASRTTEADKTTPEATTKQPATSNGTAILQKEALPANKKGAPTDFYIVNDQPVDREAYLRHLKQSPPKN